VARGLVHLERELRADRLEPGLELGPFGVDGAEERHARALADGPPRERVLELARQRGERSLAHLRDVAVEGGEQVLDARELVRTRLASQEQAELDHTPPRRGVRAHEAAQQVVHTPHVVALGERVAVVHRDVSEALDGEDLVGDRAEPIAPVDVEPAQAREARELPGERRELGRDLEPARLTWMIFFVQFKLPAFAFLGFWAAINLIGAVSGAVQTNWYAHLGGFAYGAPLALLIHAWVERRNPIIAALRAKGAR
jgi:hypothetical protein